MDIQPIPTKYKNIEFRSRLEARWAVFFDSLDIKWLYENEGYQTSAGNYLPDFWLPEVYLRGNNTRGILFEVKPDNFELSHPALEEIANKLDVGAILARGFDYDIKYHSWDSESLIQVAPGWDHNMLFYPCKCGKVKFEFSEGSYMHCVSNYCTINDYKDSMSRVSLAYKNAIQYKFW